VAAWFGDGGSGNAWETAVSEDRANQMEKGELRASPERLAPRQNSLWQGRRRNDFVTVAPLLVLGGKTAGRMRMHGGVLGVRGPYMKPG
jgi:hypothetical protein